MIEQRVFEYLVNSLWQVPLIVGSTWIVIRIARPRVSTQHWLWLAALALSVLMPLRGIGVDEPADAAPAVAMANDADLPVATPARLPELTSAPRVNTLSGLRLRTIPLQPRTVDWLVGLYGVSIAFGLARLLHGWIATKRLIAETVAHPLTTLESSLLRACSRQIDLPATRIPEIRFSVDEVIGPLVAGVRNPVLLLPETLRQRGDLKFDDEALTAVLLHELTHVRRRDYLANLAARLLTLPIGYHPATHLLQQRIRQTREMICDATAAQAFPTNSSYARSLLSLAEGIVSKPSNIEAVGLFDSTRNSLEERIMKLTETNLAVSLKVRSARIAAGTLVLVAATGAASTLHLKTSPPVVYAMQSNQTVATPDPTPAAAPAPQALPEPQVAAPAHDPKPAAKPAPNPKPVHETLDATNLTADQAEQQAADARNQVENLKVQVKIDPIVVPKFDFKGMDTVEFQKAMADMKLQFDSPEFRKQMDQMKAQMNSPEFRKQIEQAAKAASLVNSGEFKRQMEEMNRQLNSPEFKQQIEMSKKLAMEARANADQRTAEMRKQLAEASAAIAEAKKQVQDEKVRKQLDEAERRIQEATKP